MIESSKFTQRRVNVSGVAYLHCRVRTIDYQAGVNTYERHNCGSDEIIVQGFDAWLDLNQILTQCRVEHNLSPNTFLKIIFA